MAKYWVRNKQNGGKTTADIDFETQFAVIFYNNATNGMTLGAFKKDWEILEPVKESDDE